MPRVRCPVDGTEFDIAPSHLARLTRDPTCSEACKRKSMQGEGHWRFSTGRYVDGDGYVRVLTPDGYQMEHRVKMERKLGRKLRANERVRHKNEKRADNRASNLLLVRVKRAPQKRGRAAA